MSGTPKQLKQSILNGLNESIHSEVDFGETASRVGRHVKDFMAQKFGVALLSAKNADEELAIRELWDTLFSVQEPHRRDDVSTHPEL